MAGFVSGKRIKPFAGKDLSDMIVSRLGWRASHRFREQITLWQAAFLQFGGGDHFAVRGWGSFRLFCGRKTTPAVSFRRIEGDDRFAHSVPHAGRKRGVRVRGDRLGRPLRRGESGRAGGDGVANPTRVRVRLRDREGPRRGHAREDDRGLNYVRQAVIGSTPTRDGGERTGSVNRRDWRSSTGRWRLSYRTRWSNRLPLDRQPTATRSLTEDFGDCFGGRPLIARRSRAWCAHGDPAAREAPPGLQTRFARLAARRGNPPRRNAPQGDRDNAHGHDSRDSGMDLLPLDAETVHHRRPPQHPPMGLDVQGSAQRNSGASPWCQSASAIASRGYPVAGGMDRQSRTPGREDRLVGGVLVEAGRLIERRACHRPQISHARALGGVVWRR